MVGNLVILNSLKSVASALSTRFNTNVFRLLESSYGRIYQCIGVSLDFSGIRRRFIIRNGNDPDLRLVGFT